MASDNSSTSYNKKKAPDLAWSSAKDVFFTPSKITEDRWNQVYPYRLIVWDIRNNKIVTKDGGNANSVTVSNYFKNGDDFSVVQELVDNVWEFTLPITPQQLSIQDLYAISNTPTLRGIVEEHNGIKYKNISMAGTFGIFTKRNALSSALKSKGVTDSLFAGTLESVSSVTSSINKLSQAWDGGHPAGVSPNINEPGGSMESRAASGTSGGPGELYETGYYNAMMCGQFLEQYSMAKKDPKNSSWRLVLDMPKRNESYVVTPVSYVSSQSVNKPSEYMFQMQLKAWKRIDLKQAFLPVAPSDKISLNSLQKLNNSIRELRTLIAQTTNTVKAVRADFQSVMNTLRQMSLVVKDTAGLAQTAIDLGPNMLKDLKDTITDVGRNIDTKISLAAWKSGSSIGSAVTQLEKTSITVSALKSMYTQNQGQTPGAADSNTPAGGSGTTNSSIGDKGLSHIFDEPEANFGFYDAIGQSSLTLTQNQQDTINDEMTLLRLTNTSDLKKMKATLQSVALDLADHYGAGNATIAKIYNRPTPKTRSTPMTIEENELIQALYEVIAGMDELTASKKFDTKQQLTQTSLELVGGLASNVDIKIDSYNSKYQAPVPYGLSMEQIAMRYLKSPDKWIEIVTINALREPYIDEVGFFYSLLSNSDGRAFTVDDSQNNLFIGQKITLSDDNTLPFVRKIIDINKISDSSYLITVDGDADLTLTTASNAKLQAYLPGTVNSQNIIYIPSNLPSDPTSELFPIANLSEDKLNNLANVDFLVDDSGDLAINSVGDFRLANGLTNLIQALKLKIQTKKGSLVRHSGYGLGITAGMSTADINSGELINSLNQMIKEDSRFDSISTIQITLKNNILNIDMVVNLANRTGVLPINFDTRI